MTRRRVTYAGLAAAGLAMAYGPIIDVSRARAQGPERPRCAAPAARTPAQTAG
ncbi:MAG: polysaccharide deacetylase family protein, partial [Proteobacteria bacterium]|nr:polysaccharide deacetylase family protein [Pseudomonadota bacterium]